MIMVIKILPYHRFPHYDITSDRIRELAIKNGAVIVSNREIVKILKEYKSKVD